MTTTSNPNKQNQKVTYINTIHSISMFKMEDIDTLLIDLIIDPTELKKMRLINKYYNEKIKKNSYYKLCRQTYEYKLPKIDNTNKLFAKACSTNNLKLCKFIYFNSEVDIHREQVFLLACENGSLEVAQWLHTIGVNIHVVNKKCVSDVIIIHLYGDNDISVDTKGEKAFVLSCEKGHMKVAQWLHTIGVNIHTTKKNAFESACESGHLKVAQWLHELYTDIDTHTIENAFLYSCIEGHLEIAKWLHTMGVNIYAIKEIVFRSTCGNGRLDVAKWLHKLYTNIDITTIINAFLETCSEGHLEVAQWLHQLNMDIDINIISVAFMMSCFDGHLEVAKWLYTFDINIHANRDESSNESTDEFVSNSENNHIIKSIAESIFIKCCARGHLEIVKWLHELGVNIRIDNECAFKKAREKERTNIVEWFITIDPDYKYL